MNDLPDSSKSYGTVASTRARLAPWLLRSTLLIACNGGASLAAPGGEQSPVPAAEPPAAGAVSVESEVVQPVSDRSEPDASAAAPDAAATPPTAQAAGPSADASGTLPSGDAGLPLAPIDSVDAAHAADAAKPAASIYDDDAKWLCRPGLPNNRCLDTIRVTDVHADGTTTVSDLAKTPDDVQADCLYLYPTVDPGLLTARNLDFDQIDKTTVRGIFLGQGMPFREACALWAPLYRQASLNSFEQEETREKGLETAYRDLEQAFEYYLGHSDARRPIVIVAHSQGAIVMSRLLKRRFEGHPELLQRLVVAVLAGPLGGFVVPDGKLVGGTLGEIPLCTSERQTGCALTYATFGAKVLPNADYGRVNGGVKPGFDTGCTTPPGGVDAEPARLSGTLFASTDGLLAFLGPRFDYGRARVETQLARYADFYTARCARSVGGLSYLQITAEPLIGDVRVDPVPYDHLVLNSADVGLHALDYTFVSGDLVRSVKTRLEAYGK